MICEKSELKRILRTERELYHYKKWYDLPIRLTEEQVLYKHQKYLRKAEYAYNTQKWYRRFALLRLLRIQTLHGLSVPMNVFDEGLAIVHLGNVIVNGKAKVGKNCRLHPGVCIGAAGGNSAAPVIGNDVYIGPGAKVFGDITLADGITVGANAVVKDSCLKEGALLVGVPALAK